MILGTIIVVECDGCQTIVTLVSDAQHDKFNKEWHHDLTCDYCPDCHINCANLSAEEMQEILDGF